MSRWRGVGGLILGKSGERAEKGAFKVSQLVDSRTIGWGREGGMGLPQAHALY